MIKVLIVDDSVVFRSQISTALNGVPQIEIIGSAPNGSIALQRLRQLSVDLVTLDMEMPEMDGLEVLKEIRAQGLKVRVIVFSSQTTRGAEKAILALEAGADDVVAKPSGDQTHSAQSPSERIREALVPKILQFEKDKDPSYSTPTQLNKHFPSSEPTFSSKEVFPKLPLEGYSPSVVVIASSTGGPTALENIFTHLTPPVRVPILIAQHMPPIFTQSLAKRLANLANVPCKEASHGEPLASGHVYVAPGDFHLTLHQNDLGVVLKLNQSPQRNSVRPAADYLFESAAQIFRSKCLGIVLTGMGEDGLQGSLAIKRAGGRILIQNKESCVVFGMPGAIFKSESYDGIGNLVQIANILNQATK